MKILFLDFDGVLNSQDFFRNRAKREAKTQLTWKENQIDKSAIEHLNTLCSIFPDLKIVVSSVWRKFNSINDLAKLLESKGFWYGRAIIDKTPDFDIERGLEIQEWLNNYKPLNFVLPSELENSDSHWHKVDNFAIIDDDSDMEHLMSFLFKTNNKSGFTEEVLDKLIKYFKE